MQAKSNIRFVCIGDLVADYYYTGKLLTKVDGGRSKFNDLANLGVLGNKCTTFSCYGNSNVAEMLCQGLKKCNVDVSHIKRINVPNRIYNLVRNGNGEYRCIKNCPICGNSTWYEDSILWFGDIFDELRENDVFIFDSLKSEDIRNISQLSEYEILLDLGNSNHLKKMTDEELSEVLKTKFEIVQINGKVANYIIKRFKKLKNYEELFCYMNCKFLIITLGKDGAYFITSSIIVERKLNSIASEIDTLGAGDAFFSTFIDGYYRNEKNVNEEFIDKYYRIANMVTSTVVKSEGGRGHLYPKIEIKKKSGICVCKDFDIQSGR